jgi:hemoglobin-like flavoprotein
VVTVDRQPQLTKRFYEILFQRYPQAKPLFTRNSPNHLEDAPWLDVTLKELGARNVGYGVTDEMYGWVRDCLVAALKEAGGPYWTAELEKAWTAAFSAITRLMLAGAAEA